MTQITLHEVVDLAQEIVDENPKLINPTNASGMCLYNAPPANFTAKLANLVKNMIGKPKAAQHCLGGEVLHRLGLALPPEGQPVLETVAWERLTKGAMAYLMDLQFNADVKVNGTPNAWGIALSRTNQEFSHRSLYNRA